LGQYASPTDISYPEVVASEVMQFTTENFYRWGDCGLNSLLSMKCISPINIYLQKINILFITFKEIFSLMLGWE
jgi:hypothetical protein